MLKSWLAVVALCFSTALILAFSFFPLSGDVLFFMSDARSIAVVILGLAPVFFIAILLALAAARLVLRRSVRAGHVLQMLFASLLAATPVYLLLNYIDSALLITIRGKYLLSKHLPLAYPEFLWLIIWPALVILAWRRIARSPAREAVLQRTRTAALCLAPLSLCLGLLALAAPAHDEAAAPRRLVLIVLDGWPTALSPAFADPGEGGALSGAMSGARAFPNAHSSAVWTNGYFGTLYKGTPTDAFAYLDPFRMVMEGAVDSDANLIGELQKHGVAVRGIYYHRNGLPESSSGNISSYSGFRSLFALPHHTPLLHALGLDYFLVTRGPTRQANLGNDIRPWILSRIIPWLSPRPIRGDVLSDLLIPEMEMIARRSDKSTLIFHYSWTLGGGMPSAWDSDSPDTDGFLKEVRRNGYRYPADKEGQVTALRESAARHAAGLEGQLARFLDDAGRKGLLDDTLVIITSDHGTSYADGRLWYGFHPQETVARTPVLMFGDVEPGIDSRPAETIDLTRTILGRFAPGTTLNPLAADLLAPQAKEWTASFTQPSDAAGEWFVSIYEGQGKTRCNIHPDGNGMCTRIEVDGYEERIGESRTGADEVTGPRLALVFRQYGLDRLEKTRVHPAFRDLLDREGDT